MSNIVVFYDPSFPGAPTGADAARLSAIGEVCAADRLADALASIESGEGCLVSLHSPYFPKDAWSAILAFLRRGGGLVSVGGAPFKRPVRRTADGWRAEAEQTAYHRLLNIHETLPVAVDPIRRLKAHRDYPAFAGAEALLPVSPVWNLVPHVTKASDLPHQMGSAGPMDARLTAVVKGISAEGREVAASVVLWDNLGGAFAGGRWLFVLQPFGDDAYRTPAGTERLAAWARDCACGVTDLWLKPSYASYELGERLQFAVQGQRLGARGRSNEAEWTVQVRLSKAGDARALWEQELRLVLGEDWEQRRFVAPVDLEPGYYELIAEASSDRGESRTLRQGFWCRDEALLRSGSPIACDRDYFRKDGRPLPVVGMTYMTSDVARKFLFLPNVSVWDRDMAQMKKAGITWIRTGIWTAYRNVMQVDGHASEEVLRSIDAFLATAKRHDLQVTFTFFSFTPETWEGVNPYLDPRSVEAQKRFIRSIVSRHVRTTNVDWDLINEPSMFDPARIFDEGARPCGDPFEQEAYSAWLARRHGSIEELQERWNMTPDELPDFASAKPPEPSEINFSVQDIHSGKKGTRVLDFNLFSMEMHNRWAAELRATIKRLAPDQLVVVGQDEALGAQRPSPFFYGEAVDYTTVHSWWLNDHLLWDGVFAKTTERPNLVQETGMMYVETPDGRAKRSEAELRAMLERKYAYAFATGGAGAVQWIWNTNYYMNNANESHIGALRADGTEKPEADVSYDFGRFMGETRDLFRGRELEEIVVVFPYSNDFSNRRLAFDATTKLTRVMSYELKQPFRAIGEYQLHELKLAPPKLIVVPSPHNFADEAFAQLTAYVRESGCTLLFTGPIGIDAYWRKVERLTEKEALGARELANVVREERLDIDGVSHRLAYGNRRIAEACKEISADGRGDGAARLTVVPLGAGKLIWSPLPAELNDRTEPLAALYRYAMREAGVGADLEWLAGGASAGVYGRALRFEAGSLFVFVSEQAEAETVTVRDPRTGRVYSFELEPERAAMFAVDREGKLDAVYRGMTVTSAAAT